MSDSQSLFIAETSRILGLLAELMPAALKSPPVSGVQSSDAESVARPETPPAQTEVQPESGHVSVPVTSSAGLQHTIAGFFGRTAWETPAVIEAHHASTQTAPREAAPPPVLNAPVTSSSSAAPAPVVPPPVSVMPPIEEAVTYAAVAQQPEQTSLGHSFQNFFRAASWQGQKPELAGLAPQVQEAVLVSLAPQALSHNTQAFFKATRWQGTVDDRSESTSASTAVLNVPEQLTETEDSADAFFDDIDW
ncbi:MAG: hypothetical protein IGS03_14195 [Candidatus Sericytochromatia bacterium]|nr:hypothetical protein [Candidatus Sericytochromatia bacterium]